MHSLLGIRNWESDNYSWNQCRQYSGAGASFHFRIFRKLQVCKIYKAGNYGSSRPKEKKKKTQGRTNGKGNYALGKNHSRMNTKNTIL
jgi:hypothetical protein